MIQIDTDVLQDLSRAARTASEELESAAGLLLQITSHWDWGCQEKVDINRLIEINRSSISRLRQDSAQFTNAVQQVTNEFVQVESGISSLFEGVEGALGKILSVPAIAVHIVTDAVSTSAHTGGIEQIPMTDASSILNDLGKGAK